MVHRLFTHRTNVHDHLQANEESEDFFFLISIFERIRQVLPSTVSFR